MGLSAAETHESQNFYCCERVPHIVYTFLSCLPL